MLSKSYIWRLEKRVSELIKENKDLKGVVSQYCPHCRYNKNPCDYPYIADKIVRVIKDETV
jgi:hypothetical protein